MINFAKDAARQANSKIHYSVRNALHLEKLGYFGI